MVFQILSCVVIEETKFLLASMKLLAFSIQIQIQIQLLYLSRALTLTVK
jgi:hypothetical protein